MASLAVAGVVAFAIPASADPAPVAQDTSSMVTATALPTVQIDGVVWAESMVGNTVYAGGKFNNARPAGAAANTQLTPRANLLSFDVTTGALNTGFAPSLNAQVLAVAPSPDGTRVYVAGDFTTADGATRNRVAAYSTSTGQLISTFAPNVNAEVHALAVTNTTVYMGGTFGYVNGVARTRLAAVNASNGALTGWAPTADAGVNAMVMTPDNSRVIAAGSFGNVNGATALGITSLDPASGVAYPYGIQSVVQDYGPQAAILSLSTDGKAIYGTGYTYNVDSTKPYGNFEGVFSADPNSGSVNWLEDCHGDTYGAFAAAGAVYTVHHEHECRTVGAFPESKPISWHRSTAFSVNATGTLLHNTIGGYGDFGGQPSPTQYNWYPNLAAGNVSGATQAAWAVTGNDKYVVEGGEFPSVNGTAQQGLVRFAIPSVQADKVGPAVGGANFTPKVVALPNGTVRVAWQSNYDYDDTNLTYQVIRADKYPTPVYTTVATSTFWNRPNIGFVDKNVVPGKTYSYYLKVLDAAGNAATGSSASVTVPTTTTPDSAYASDVAAAGASAYWRLDEASGAATDYDRVGYNDLTLSSGVTSPVAGAIGGDADTASTFDGSTAFGTTSSPVAGPNIFTEEAWFSTTSTSGGKIVGFGDSSTGNSSNYDRHVYMDAGGHLNFGVYNNGAFVVTSPRSYNDGAYHQVVASLSGAGMALYVDGRLVGTNGGTTAGQPYNGYWRVGGDSSWSGNNYFAGTIDEVSIYPGALTLAQVRQQYTDSGRTIVGSTAPTDAYGKTVWNDSPSLYYRMDETSGTTAVDLSGNSNDGAYYNGVTLNAPSTVAGTDTAASFDGNAATVSSPLSQQAPSVYTEEAWINTTSQSGGKIIGFGDNQNGYSNNYDRHVYMLADGRLVFGTYTGQLNLATSTASYNDGAWHHVVATQGPDGMTLFVDGHVVATNSQTAGQNYSGYWRVGGDNLNGWNANNAFFNGTIDEVAVYSTELTPAQVLAHYEASPAAVNPAPTASFTTSTNGTTVNFDGTGSNSANGTVTGYAWDFGDGKSGTGATPTHTYGASGTFSVVLTVTDSFGHTATKTQDVTVVAANQPPTAAFSSKATDLSVAFDGSSSSDADGSVVSYAWDFGDGSTSTSATPTHTYAKAGSYTVTLTVTDNQGATNTASNTVQVAAANVAPTAAFTSNATNLSVAFDGTGSSDSDGTVASYAWDFGDGASSTSATPTHAYAKAGTYTVKLMVTDNAGATDSATKSVTVTAPANVAPTAAFTSNATNLSVAFDGTGSSDSDGTVASYAWDFGDGGTSTSMKPTHTYSAAGTYTVKLTVTDDKGATNSVSKSVTVSSAVVASDTFSRTGTGKWGTADVGGAWTIASGASLFSTNGTAGQVNLNAAGVGVTAMLNSVSATNTNATIDTSTDKAGTSNGVYVTLAARHVGTSEYRLKERLLPNGVVHLVVSKLVSGTETTISEVVVSGLTYNVGDTLRLRFIVTGDGTKSTIAGKVWKVGSTEPAANQISVSDSTAALQGAGSFGVEPYLSGGSTNAPVMLTVDNLSIVRS